MQLESDLVYGSNPSISSKNTKSPDSSARNRKREDSTLINDFHNLLQIESDLFKDLILDDLVLYMQSQNKEKGIS